MQSTNGTKKLPSKFPHTIKRGSAFAKIYRVSNRGRVLFSLVYYTPTGRKIRQFADLAEAIKEGEGAAEAINNGKTQTLELTGSDREAYLHAKKLLGPTGISLTAALTEYLEAKQIGVPLLTAAQFYHSKKAGDVVSKKVADILEEFLAAKKQDGMSLRYLSDMRSRLGRFAQDFQTDIASIDGQPIDIWLRGLGVGARSRNNYLVMLRTFFLFAQSRKYLPKGKTEIDGLSRAKDRGGEIGIFKPGEFASLLSADYKALKLETAKPEILIPYFVLGGFCGLRHAEVTRIDWSEIDLNQKIVRVTAAKAKTAQNRIVPICDAAMEWLSLSPKKSGQVCSDRQSKIGRAVAEKLGIAWPQNALRHSFASYRLAQAKSAPQVALEMGNSPDILFTNYRSLVTEADAERWFSIKPSAAGQKIVRFRKRA